MPVTAEEKIERALCELADWAWQQRHDRVLDEAAQLGTAAASRLRPVVASGHGRIEIVTQ
jgi:hypothetical protein